MSVALSVTVLAGRHWACDQIDVGLKAAGWVPLPARGDRGRGAVVSALRPVLPRRRGAPGRARHRGRPRHGLSVGADLHGRVHRRRPPESPCDWDRWFVDETYVKVSGRWTYLYRAVDQHGQVIDVLLSDRRDARAARTYFTRALSTRTMPVEVTTDRAPVYPGVIEEFAPQARPASEQYANNVVEADHGRLKSRLRPMRGAENVPLAAHRRGRAGVRAEPAPRPL
jgi:DDE domain